MFLGSPLPCSDRWEPMPNGVDLMGDRGCCTFSLPALWRAIHKLRWEILSYCFDTPPLSPPLVTHCPFVDWKWSNVGNSLPWHDKCRRCLCMALDRVWSTSIYLMVFIFYKCAKIFLTLHYSELDFSIKRDLFRSFRIVWKQ